MTLFEFVSTLKLDDNQFKQGLDAAGSSMNSFEGIAAQAFTKVVSVLGDAAKAVVSLGSEFSAQMSVVQALSGSSANEMVLLADKAKYMGATTQFTAKQAGEALEYMALAGWKSTDMLDGLEGIMYAAGAAGEDLGRISDIVTDGLTAFGMAANESGRFADVLAATAANSNTNITMLGEAFKYAAPVAGALGFTIEDTALSLGLMANAGIKASQGGTALRNIMTNMVNPTAKMQAAMDTLGLEVTNADGSMKSMREILVDLRGGFSNLTEAEKAQTAAMLAGKYGMAGLLAIVTQSDEAFDALAESIDESAGAAKRMNEIRLDNLAGDMVILESALQGLGIQIFDSFETPLRTAAQAGIQAVTQLASELAKPGMKKSLDSIGEGFTALIQAASNLMAKVIPVLVSAVGTAINTFNIWGPAIAGVMTAMAAYKVITAWTDAVNLAKTAVAASSTVTEGLTLILGKNAAARAASAAAEAAGTAITTASTASTLAENGALTAKSLIVGVLSGQIPIVTALQVVWNTVLSAFPIIAIVAGITALVAIIPKLIEWINRETEEEKKLKEETDEVVASNEALIESYRESESVYQDRLTAIDDQVEANSRLGAKILETVNAEEKTYAQHQLMIARLAELNDALGANVLSYDAEKNAIVTSSGAIIDNQEALEALLEKRADNTRTEAFMARESELGQLMITTEKAIVENERAVEELQEQYEAGSIGNDVYNESMGRLRESSNQLNTELDNLGAELEQVSSVTQEAMQKQAEAFGITAEAFDQMSSTILNGSKEQGEVLEMIGEAYSNVAEVALDSFNKIESKAESSIQKQIETLEHNKKATAEWSDNIVKLYERAADLGLEKGYINQLREKGPEAAAEIKQMVDASDQELSKLIELATDTTGEVLDAIANAYNVDTEVAQAAKSLVEETGMSFDNAIRAVGFDKKGAEISRGLAKGVQSGEGDVEKAATNIADAVADTVDKELGIASPSKVAIKQGQEYDAGLMQSLKKVPGNAQKALEPIKPAVDKIGDSMIQSGKTKTTSFMQSVTSITQTVPGKIQTNLNPAIQQTSSWGDRVAQMGKTKMQSLQQGIQQTTKPIPNQMKSTGDNIITGFWNGMGSKENWLLSKVKGLFGGVMDSVKKFFKIQSPSKVFENIGEMVDMGFVNGIMGKQGAVNGAISEVFDGLAPDAGSIDSALGGYRAVDAQSNHGDAAEMLNGIYQLLQEMLPAMQNLQVVLDSGALVGEILPEVNDGLGTLSDYGERWNG